MANYNMQSYAQLIRKQNKKSALQLYFEKIFLKFACLNTTKKTFRMTHFLISLFNLMTEDTHNKQKKRNNDASDKLLNNFAGLLPEYVIN